MGREVQLDEIARLHRQRVDRREKRGQVAAGVGRRVGTGGEWKSSEGECDEDLAVRDHERLLGCSSYRSACTPWMQQLSICLHPIEEFNTSGSWPALPVLGARLYAGL